MFAIMYMDVHLQTRLIPELVHASLLKLTDCSFEHISGVREPIWIPSRWVERKAENIMRHMHTDICMEFCFKYASRLTEINVNTLLPQKNV